MSVRRAQQEIDSAEFTDWLAFYDLEPWGSGIEDLRAGTGIALLANVNRDVKKHPEPFMPLDFFGWVGSPDKADKEPILLADPKAQSALIVAVLFGRC
ncbi:phage tail assembly protein T [Caballeronia sp. DA-9]|uniref:phage tail assembly protein T n=1 Tax=Caballeronia sp. DA-9 TaxID=3436237 RepID=UPI003F669798